METLLQKSYSTKWEKQWKNLYKVKIKALQSEKKSELEKNQTNNIFKGSNFAGAKRAENGKLTGIRPGACCVATDLAGNTWNLEFLNKTSVKVNVFLDDFNKAKKAKYIKQKFFILN